MVEDSPAQIDQCIKDAPCKPSRNRISGFSAKCSYLSFPPGFRKGQWSSLGCAISVTLVLWPDTSLFHQSSTSGPPGAGLKCHPEPLQSRASPVSCYTTTYWSVSLSVLYRYPLWCLRAASFDKLLYNGHTGFPRVIMIYMKRQDTVVNTVVLIMS